VTGTLFLALLILALGALSIFIALKLVGFLRRGEGWFRGSHVFRSESPTLYWWIVGVLSFGLGATWYGLWVLATLIQA
jgi:hypothetical protein